MKLDFLHPSMAALSVAVMASVCLRADPGPINCDTAVLALGSASAEPASLAEIGVLGQVACEVNGLSMAVGYDASQLHFVEARPGSFLVGQAGADLVFNSFDHPDEGYLVLFVAFDLSFPLDVPPAVIPPDTLLATLVFEVQAGAAAGAHLDLQNENQVFGMPNPISNIYTVPPGMKEIYPVLESGSIAVTEKSSFERGDANGDQFIDLGDALSILFFLFLEESERIPCQKGADVDDNGALELPDAMSLLNYLFLEGPAPSPPFPACGNDTTPDHLPCDTLPNCR